MKVKNEVKKNMAVKTEKMNKTETPLSPDLLRKMKAYWRAVNCLLRAVPAAVPGVAFLSGGQSGELASARLNAMNVRFKSRLPWALTFSFTRAIQQPALEVWQGDAAHVLAAQQATYHRARCNRAARLGQYRTEMENNVDSRAR